MGVGGSRKTEETQFPKLPPSSSSSRPATVQRTPVCAKETGSGANLAGGEETMPPTAPTPPQFPILPPSSSLSSPATVQRTPVCAGETGGGVNLAGGEETIPPTAPTPPQPSPVPVRPTPREWLPPDLLSVVFSWSLDDIYNESLFKDQVEDIPWTFASVDQYLNAFIYPLLEEVRCSVCSSMDTISDASFASIKQIRKHRSRLYKITVHSWIHNSDQQGESGYKPIPGDILVLSDAIPESVSDLRRHGRTYMLAAVTGVADDNESHIKFEVKVSADISETDNLDRSFFLVSLLNLTSFSRVWKALAVGRRRYGNLDLINKILSTKSLDGSMCSKFCNSTETKEQMAELVCSSELNESQTAAVISCLTEIQCNKHLSIKLVWGPPGTGKTKTVGELLKILLNGKHRVLTCAPTNVAIIEISSRLLALVKDRRPAVSLCETLCPLGDIVLFGNKTRLKIPEDHELFDIFLDHRVDVLVRCLAPLSGWNHHLSSFICFLEDSVSEYNVHIANENCKSGIQVHENPDCTFLTFFRRRFNVLARALRECTQDLYIHLPSSSLLELKIDLVDLVDKLSDLERLISQPEVINEQFGDALISCDDVEDSLQFSFEFMEKLIGTKSRSLIEARKHGLELLRRIEHRFVIPMFFDATAIRDFCLGSSKLVFCTAVTSFKLLGCNAFDSLVIDEASQLKECESIIPLQISGIRSVTLIGDECQLPATVQSKVAEDAHFGRSLFQRLNDLDYPYDLLKVQCRMHPSISVFPNRKFYSGMIEDASIVRSKDYTKHYLPEKMYGPFSFINVADGREEIHANGHSKRNMVEVVVVLQIIQRLLKASSSRKEKISVGIISPYAAQVACIQEKIQACLTNECELTVKVKSVDGFQGGEMDVVIISTVRSNLNGTIGFLASNQRANVALTRARHCLWVVGNAATLVNSGSVWEALVRDAKDRSCFFNADDDAHLLKAVLKMKKDLDQLHDLLNKDSILFRTVRWKVLFSDSFRRSFAKIKSASRKKIVINMLLKLAGGWRPRNLNVAASGGDGVFHLIRQYKVENLYIICTIDIVKYSVYTQVLKIWDILLFSEIPNFTKRLENIFSMYTDDYISRCKEKCIEGKSEIPMTWNRGLDIVQYKSIKMDIPADVSEDSSLDGRTFAENSKVSESLMLMKFYSLSSGTVEHLLSGRDGKEVELPFEVTDQEREIIVFPGTTFILGRSGTGKTTILTMKLIQREQLYRFSSDGLYDSQTYSLLPKSKLHRLLDDSGIAKVDGLHQLFVTVSSKLCSAIKGHIRRLKRFAEGEESLALDMYGSTSEVDDGINEFVDLPDNFLYIKPNHYPLVITFWKFLMMLDGSLGSSFFDRFQDLQELQIDERGYWRFPAFHAFLRQKEVNYERFALIYWPHFSSKLTKKLDCAVVFKEIISHIKGGLTCLDACDKALTRETYINLSRTRSSTLNESEREMIFDIFLDYENMKCQHGDFDLSDFVADIHGRLNNCELPFSTMDFVYIDEVQDLTMRQISLFKYICNNFKEGFIFAGDTAQTIARGIDFRFQDIRSLFYTEFLTNLSTATSSTAKDKVSNPFDFFHLTQNFRTHVGILKLAQSVVELLYSFFPHSVDRLIPENSLIYGEAPILLESNDENAIITIFGSCGGKISENYSGFGAEQVILVRDSTSKEQISAHVGKRALVLTIIECKGLEFQDVLLYNFFSSSPLRSQWRVIYSYMKDNHLMNLSDMVSFPSFEHSRHSILCSELKQLYVAITRTRQRLWICESDKEYSKPMFDYWKNLCIVQTRQLDESLAQSMCVASSKDEWRDRGKKLYSEGNYEMATMCFERAGDVNLERLAKAAGLRDSGIRILDTNFEMARGSLVEAAEIYEAIGKEDSAAQCYIHLKEFKKAGTILLEKCGDAKLEDAADCFFQAGCWDKAAEIFARSNNISKCLSACSKGQLFEKGLSYIKSWKRNTSTRVDSGNSETMDKLKNSFLEKCAVYYDGIKDKRNMMRFVRSYTSIERMRDFLKSRDYLDEMFIVEDELGNFTDAADIARIKGDLLGEARMLEKVGAYERASKLILFNIVLNSLWASKNKGWPPISYTDKELHISHAKSLAEKFSPSFHHVVSLETRLLADIADSLEVELDCLREATRGQHFRAQILAARKVLDIHLRSVPYKFVWTNDTCNRTLMSEDCLLQSDLSLKLFMYAWNVWKEKISTVLRYLKSTESFSDDCFLDCQSFCFEYFGVKKLSSQKCLVLNHEAVWINDLGCRFINKEKNLIYVELHHFLPFTKRYWTSELLNVGIEILRKMDILYRFSEDKQDSHLIQGTIVLCIFCVSKFLTDLESVKERTTSTEAEGFLSQSITRLEKFLFLLDPRKSANKNATSLRRDDFSLSMQPLLLKKSIDMLISRPSLGRIGRFMVIFFGTVDIRDDEYSAIVNAYGLPLPWKSFIEKLQKNDDSRLREISLLDAFVDALKFTFEVDWRKEREYITPQNFLYLVDRLLFLSLSCRGSYFTTRCSLVEAINGPRRGAFGVMCGANEYAPKKSLMPCFDFVACVAVSLLSSKAETFEWIKKSHIKDQDGYYRHLVLRLVTMTGLVYLNSKLHLDSLKKVLSCARKFKDLPQPFHRWLEVVNEVSFTSNFAEALKALKDPLVIVGFKDEALELSGLSEISLKLDGNQGREEMLNVLFPESPVPISPSLVTASSSAPQDTHLSAASKNRCLMDVSTNLLSQFPCSSAPVGSGDLMDDSDNIRNEASEPGTKNEEAQLRKIYSKLWLVLEQCVSGNSESWEEAGEFSFLASLNVKDDIGEAILMLEAVLGHIDEKNAGEIAHLKELADESHAMLGELRMLSDALTMRDADDEKKGECAKEIFEMMYTRKPTLQVLLDSLNHEEEAEEAAPPDKLLREVEAECKENKPANKGNKKNKKKFKGKGKKK